MQTTMRDVARAAGVSVATVSYVLTDRADVSISSGTRERVLREARRLNYRHNALAADLRRGVSPLVGIQLYSLAVQALARKVGAFEQAIRQAGLYPYLCHVLDEDAERMFFNECASRRVRGVVLTRPPTLSARAHVRQLMVHRVPVVATEPVPELGLPYATVDRAGAAELAVRHLLSLGHTRIGAVIGFTGRGREDFLGGYEGALRERGVEPDLSWVVPAVPGEGWYRAGVRCAQELMRVTPRPTAIVTTDDEVALGAMRWLQREGLRVPEDVALVGCDNTPAAEFADVPLTTLAQPAETLGTTLAGLMLEALEDPERIAGREIRLSMELVVRASCGAGHAS